eukprot:scaffold11642_cov103-Isochrysis_galbana.AAC.3
MEILTFVGTRGLFTTTCTCAARHDGLLVSEPRKTQLRARVEGKKNSNSFRYTPYLSIYSREGGGIHIHPLHAGAGGGTQRDLVSESESGALFCAPDRAHQPCCGARDRRNEREIRD